VTPIGKDRAINVYDEVEIGEKLQVYRSKGGMHVEQVETATKIWKYLVGKGWTKESVAAVLGNMESESGIIADRWESDNIGNMAGGYGLVQWTPATKYINWAKANGLVYQDVISQCKRLEWEVANQQQFSHPSMTFKQFTQSKQSPEVLADIFIRYYERPYNANQPLRQTQARKWFNLLQNISGTPSTITKGDEEDMMYIYTKRLKTGKDEVWFVNGSSRMYLPTNTYVNEAQNLIKRYGGSSDRTKYNYDNFGLKMIELSTKVIKL
jgi:hypothetical protein